MARRTWPTLFLVLLGCGCGPGWEAVAGGTGSGYDVYRPEPYLLVVQGATARTTGTTQPSTRPLSQQYTANIIYLPDYSQRYRVRSTTGGTNIYVKDGWELTSLTDQNAASSLLNSALSAASPSGQVGGSALNLLGLVGGEPLSASGSSLAQPGGGPGPQPLIQRGVALYKIIYGHDGRVTGLVRVEASEPDESERHHKLSDHAPPSVPSGEKQ